MTEHIFKVPDVSCKITGTDDYGDGTYPMCKSCSYYQCCTAKYNEEELIEAKELYQEYLKVQSDADALEERYKKLFNKVISDNGLVKFQFDNLIISDIYVKQTTSYPKAKLLKAFTPEQLEPAAEIKEAYHYLRVDDMLKQKEKKND